MEDSREIIVKTLLMPAFYRDFKCMAEDCHDDCCRNWSIKMNKKDYLSLRRENVSAEFKKRLEEAAYRLQGTDADEEDYAQFQLDEGGCCLLRDPDGLCSLQKKLRA